MALLVYVDDLVIAANDEEACSKFKSYLHNCFSIKDLGPLKYFLEIEMARGPHGLFLCQCKYALEIIDECGSLGPKLTGFLMKEDHKLALASRRLLNDPTSYRCMIGRLIYLTITRPDFTYAVHILSQFMQQPREEHTNAVKCVLRYLKGIAGCGLLLSSKNDLRLYGNNDSDLGGCPITVIVNWLLHHAWELSRFLENQQTGYHF